MNASREKFSGMVVHHETNRICAVRETTRVPGSKRSILDRFVIIHQQSPILGIVPKSNLNCVMIEIRHLHGAADFDDAAQKIPLARKRHINLCLDGVRIRRHRAVRAGVGRRLWDAVIDRPLPRFGRIDGVDALIDNISWTVVIRQQVVSSIDFNFAPHIIQLSRHAVREKNFDVPMIGRTQIGWQQARFIAHLDARQAGRNRKIFGGGADERALHHIVPQRSRAGDSADVLHLRIVRVAYPNPRDKIRRPSDRPVVAKIVRRSGFHHRWPR